MKNSAFLTTTGVFLLVQIILGLGAIAQPTDSISPDPNLIDTEEPSGSASDLRISPRLGIGHNTSGAGFDGTTRFEGFIPLWQHPGHTITFVEPRFLLDNDGNMGGNLLFGHRAYSQSNNRIWGGYVSFDNRRTDHSDFYQLGLGLETLGDVWDFRLNGYLPIGDTRQLVSDRAFDTGLELSTGFQENQFVLSSSRELQRFTIREAALGGFDAEVGARLVRWNQGNGDLRGYAGLYFYDGRGVDSTLGWRLGVEARPVQNLVLGVSVQEDDIFGTNIIGSVGLTWPRVRPRGPITGEQTVADRLGESVRRIPSIAVDTQTEVETRIEASVGPLMNPEEERAYRFIHVTLGRRGGDGTFENPFGTIQDALDASISDGNAIVYVDAGQNPDIPAFTIPNRVRVLSQGPVQLLAGMPFPGFPEAPSRLPFSPVTNFDEGILVTLPLSGDTNFPTIRDAGANHLVRMRTSTVLSGFQIADAPENAVIANSVANVEIRDNTITNAGDRGILLNDVSGSVVLFDNVITGSLGTAGSGQAILIYNRSSTPLEATIANHRLRNNQVGIEIIADGTRSELLNPLQIVDIDTTQIANSRTQGLRVEANELGNQLISFSNGSITNSGAEGALLETVNVGSQEITIEDSRIANNANSGIRAVAGVFNGSSTAAQEVFINRNQIENNGGAGIDIEGNEAAAQEFAIGGNLIQTNTEEGIRAIARNASFQEYVTDVPNNSLGISNNIIRNNGSQGISINAQDSATVIADIQENQLSDNGATSQPNLEITVNDVNNDACIVLLNNTSTNGIRINNNVSGTPGFFQIGNLSTVSTLNISPVTLLPNLAAYTDLPNTTSCFRD